MKKETTFLEEYKKLEHIDGTGLLLLDLALLDEDAECKFRFAINGREPEDYVVNHRYPNPIYKTISRSCKNRCFAFGYPYCVEFGNRTIRLQLQAGRNDYWQEHVLNIQTKLTAENPVCILEIVTELPDANSGKVGRFAAATAKRYPDMGWHTTLWQNYGISRWHRGAIQLGMIRHAHTEDGPVGVKDIFVYNGFIVPAAEKPEDLLTEPMVMLR